MNSAQPLTVFITGASSGIGAGFARAFHQQGAKVILVARRAALLQDLADSFNKERSHSAEILVADLSNTDGHQSGLVLAERYIKNNHIDILINNAGFGSFGSFDSLTLDREEQMIRLNIIATTRLCHAVIPQYKLRRSGVIISLSSIAGFQPLPYMATYSATKAFNLTHSLALRAELRPFGIKVLTVCPGPVATEFGGAARVPGTATGVTRDEVEAVVKESLVALAANRAWIVPCLRAKLLSIPSRIFPRSLTTLIVGRLLRTVVEKVEHEREGR